MSACHQVVIVAATMGEDQEGCQVSRAARTGV